MIFRLLPGLEENRALCQGDIGPEWHWSLGTDPCGVGAVLFLGGACMRLLYSHYPMADPCQEMKNIFSSNSWAP